MRQPRAASVVATARPLTRQRRKAGRAGCLDCTGSLPPRPARPRTCRKAPMFTVRIIPTDARNLGDNRLADVDLHFTAAAGALAGLKLTGFTVCEAPTWRYVTYPACHGESADGVPFTTHFLRLIDE